MKVNSGQVQFFIILSLVMATVSYCGIKKLSPNGERFRVSTGSMTNRSESSERQQSLPKSEGFIDLRIEDSKLQRAFATASARCKAATDCGLILGRPGANILPISHRSLFLEYRHVYYLPVEADIFLDRSALTFLRARSNERSLEERELASLCIGIIESNHKVRLEIIEHVKCGLLTYDFVIYLYD